MVLHGGIHWGLAYVRAPSGALGGSEVGPVLALAVERSVAARHTYLQSPRTPTNEVSSRDINMLIHQIKKFGQIRKLYGKVRTLEYRLRNRRPHPNREADAHPNR